MTLITTVMNVDLAFLRNKCPIDITDQVFCIIEKKYMKQYDALCNQFGKNQVNIDIGKFVKKHWGLKNLGRCNNPKSSLIKSYEKHSN